MLIQQAAFYKNSDVTLPELAFLTPTQYTKSTKTTTLHQIQDCTGSPQTYPT